MADNSKVLIPKFVWSFFLALLIDCFHSLFTMNVNRSSSAPAQTYGCLLVKSEFGGSERWTKIFQQSWFIFCPSSCFLCMGYIREACMGELVAFLKGESRKGPQWVAGWCGQPFLANYSLAGTFHIYAGSALEGSRRRCLKSWHRVGEWRRHFHDESAISTISQISLHSSLEYTCAQRTWTNSLDAACGAQKIATLQQRCA